VINDVFTTTTHNWLLFFTSKGKVYRVKVHEVPESGTDRARDLRANLPGVSITGDEKVQAVIDLKEYAEGRYLLFATRKGMVKKTTLPEYDSPRTGLAGDQPEARRRADRRPSDRRQGRRDPGLPQGPGDPVQGEPRATDGPADRGRDRDAPGPRTTR
jgi:DNA gyrase/topoisomerase IV subunit A